MTHVVRIALIALVVLSAASVRAQAGDELGQPGTGAQAPAVADDPIPPPPEGPAPTLVLVVEPASASPLSLQLDLSLEDYRQTRRLSGGIWAGSATAFMGSWVWFTVDCVFGSGDACGPSVALMALSTAGLYGSALTAAIASHRAARMLEEAGYRVPRWAGIVGLIFAAVPGAGVISLIFSGVQMRQNARAARLAGLRQPSPAPPGPSLYVRLDQDPWY